MAGDRYVKLRYSYLKRMMKEAYDAGHNNKGAYWSDEEYGADRNVAVKEMMERQLPQAHPYNVPKKDEPKNDA